MGSSKSPVAAPRGRLLSLRNAATHLGVSEHQVRQLVRLREIACVRHPSGRVMGVYEADCDAWVATRRQPAQTSAPHEVAAGIDIDRRIAQIDGADRFH